MLVQRSEKVDVMQIIVDGVDNDAAARVDKARQSDAYPADPRRADARFLDGVLNKTLNSLYKLRLREAVLILTSTVDNVALKIENDAFEHGAADVDTDKEMGIRYYLQQHRRLAAA